MNKSKLFMYVSIAVLEVTIIASGATYAWYTWSTSAEDETRIVTNLGMATVYYNAGSNIEGVSLRPVPSKEDGIVKSITIKSDRDTTYKLSFNLYLDIIELGDGLKDTSFKYSLYKDSTTLVKEGNFSSDYLNSNLVECTTNNTNHIVLLSDETIRSTTSKYTLYIWIDGTMSNPNTMQNQSFNFKLHADGQNAVLGETVVQKITNLYDKASKTPAENNGITYNYAASVSLMNDRLGGTTSGLDAGNIRYYGANPNNYIDIGDIYKEDGIVGNWERLELPIENQTACYDDFDCDTHYADYGFDTVEACTAYFTNYLEDLGYSTVDELCGTTTIPKGTPKLYRIIGLFKDVELADGFEQDLVKVVRAEIIGDYSWDTSDSTVNGGYGINEWSGADLMKLLNPGYESETVGGSLWWNSGSGTCYSEENNTTTSCDFTGKGLSSNVHDKIASVVWNTGGWNDSKIYSNQMYSYERGTTVYSGRPTSWTGKVALMYPSDYGYATDFTKCSQNLYNYDSSADSYACRTNDWLFNSGARWLLTPHSSRDHSAWYVNPSGTVNYISNVSDGIAVRPVFFLNSELGIVSGDGSESNPYVVR